MKDYFNFQNLPMTIIVGLIAFAWFSFLSVVIGG